MFRNSLPGFKTVGQFNIFVKVFILSEGLLYTASNLTFPLFALFVTTTIKEVNIQIAASTISLHFMSRVLTELLISKYSAKFSEHKKVITIISGMILVCLGYLGFAFSSSIDMIYLFWALTGFGWGIATPTKMSIFSTHLDKSIATFEWSLTDATNLTLIAVATAIGGAIASVHGFRTLFIIASAINFLAILPFLYYLKHIPSKA